MQQNPLIKEYLDIAFRRKWWIILPAIVGVLFAVALFFRFPKLYRAETRVAIRDQTISRDLLRPVVDFESADLVTRIGGEVTSEQYLDELDQALKIVGRENGPRDLTELGKKLGRSIQIDTNRRDRYFNLKVVWDDPRLAASIANELAAIYIRRNQEIRSQMADQTVEQLAQKRESYERQLTSVREAIQRYRADFKFELESYQRTNETQLQNNNTDIQRIDTEIRRHQAEIDDLELQRDTRSATGEIIDQDPRVAQLLQLRARRDELRAQGFLPSHPQVAALQRQIDNLQEELRESEGIQDPSEGGTTSYLRARIEQEITRYNSEIEALREQRAALEQQNAVIQQRLVRTPDRQNELNRLVQQEENLTLLFEEALEKEMRAIDGAMIEEFEAGDKFDVLNVARTPGKPFWPDLRLFLFMGFAVGAGLGIAVVLLLEVFDQSFKSEEQLAASIDYPILAVIPDLTKAADRSRRRGKTRVRKKAS